jgi:isopenicillin N synthase-like dioxygenase
MDQWYELNCNECSAPWFGCGWIETFLTLFHSCLLYLYCTTISDRWVSTLHRVVVPNNGLPVERRQSMAYFVNVNGDALIEPLPACVTTDSPSKYPPITAKEHVMSKRKC